MAQAIASSLAAHGHDLLLAARRPEDLASLSSDCTIRYNVRCSTHAFNAEELQNHQSFIEALPVFPDITILVFGFMDDNEKVLQQDALLLRTLQVNYTGAVHILNMLSRIYKNKGHGVIVGISSVAGERGRASNYIYGSAKAGFTAYLSGLRNEMFPHGVQVLTVLPGFVRTRMTENIKTPAPLTAEPEEVAHAIWAGIQKKKNIVYVRWFWRWIMLIIRNIPEGIFKRMKL
jgi:short-subunit dehydrogenase